MNTVRTILIVSIAAVCAGTAVAQTPAPAPAPKPVSAQAQQMGQVAAQGAQKALDWWQARKVKKQQQAQEAPTPSATPSAPASAPAPAAPSVPAAEPKKPSLTQRARALIDKAIAPAPSAPGGGTPIPKS